MTNRTTGSRADDHEQCIRCDRTTSSLSKDFGDWEAVLDGDGGVICPNCLTPAERQAIDESDMELDAEIRAEEKALADADRIVSEYRQRPAQGAVEKVRENRLRRMAERQGLKLVKSRRRDPRALDFGLYVLVDDSAGNRMPGAQAPISDFAKGFGMTLDDVEATLMGKPAKRSNVVPLQTKAPVKKEQGFIGHDGGRRLSRRLDNFIANYRKATEGDA